METLQTQTNQLTFTSRQRVLFVHAHPDDETVATGEAIAQSVDAGVETFTAVATLGGATTLTYEDPDHPWAKGATIKTVRAAEYQRAVSGMGVKQDHQLFFDLPDGKLHRPLHKARLAWQIAKTILKHHITDVFTPGPEGFDGHPDHIAVHHAAVWAVRALRQFGQDVHLFAVSPDGKGAYELPVDADRKLEWTSEHYSQFPMWTADDAPDRHGLVAIRKQYGQYQPACTAQYLDAYEPFMHTETYNQVY